MKVMLLQPLYLPWIGMFDMMDQCDIFIFYDDAQFVRQSWQSRNRIKTPYGVKWLTVAVDHTKNPLGAPIKDIYVKHEVKWVEKNLNQLKEAYCRAPFFQRFFVDIADIFLKREERLADISISLVKHIAENLGIHTAFCLSSKLGIEGKGAEKVAKICQAVGANEYLDGESGRELYDPGFFSERGIELRFHSYQHPVYPQLHGDFVSHLSVLDLLFNTGDDALSIIRSG